MREQEDKPWPWPTSGTRGGSTNEGASPAGDGSTDGADGPATAVGTGGAGSAAGASVTTTTDSGTITAPAAGADQTKQPADLDTHDPADTAKVAAQHEKFMAIVRGNSDQAEGLSVPDPK